jgi:hypothetical protein
MKWPAYKINSYMEFDIHFADLNLSTGSIIQVHSVRSLKGAIFILTAMRTSNLSKYIHYA